VLVRGGRATVDKLTEAVRRTTRSWQIDGRPLFGISVFAAVEPSGLPLLLSRRLVTYSYTHQPTVGQVLDAGFSLLSSFQSPHYTVQLADDGPDEINRLIHALGTTHRNPYYGVSRRQGGDRP
jgi:transposase InsO family protein